MPEKPSANKSWLPVVGWYLLILFSIPFARSIQHVVYRGLGRQAFLWAVAAVGCSAGVMLLRRLVLCRAKWWQYLAVCAAVIVYGAWAWTLRGSPEEAFHLVEYGILGALIFRALSPRISNWIIFPVAGLLTSCCGTLDEIFQWLTPNRVFDYRDMFLNIGAGLFVQIPIALGMCPERFKIGIDPAALRLLVRLAVFQILVVLLCLCITPVAVTGLARIAPFMSYLKLKENLMTEYGYRHADLQAGEFFSRFETSELKQLDAARQSEVAAAFGAYPPSGRSRSPAYAALLRTFTPYTDPFLHEFRVHMERRDAYLGGQSAADCTIALRENIILEKYFPATLGAAQAALAPQHARRLSLCADPNAQYVSEVSKALITVFDIGHVYLLLILLLAAVLICEVRGYKILKKQI